MSENAATQQVSRWLSDFADALTGSDIDGAVALFAEESYWRDLVSFTWNITTLEGRAAIAAMLDANLSRVKPGSWRVEGEASAADGITHAWLTFETAIASGKGRIRLKGGRCWTLLTAMRELKGFEEKQGESRELGTEHGVVTDRRSWLERKTQEDAELGHSVQPYCLIIGGGQGGIGLGARLKRLGVPTIIVDKHERPGDAWRKRYKSLCLHDPVWYDHLPYLPFPDHWPVFSPKDKIADWLEMYARVMELDYWTATECLHAEYGNGEWKVDVLRDGAPLTLRPTHLVLATGMSGFPSAPLTRGEASFRRAGGFVCHSSSFTSGTSFRGQKCVVVGSSTSAHDICADLVESGAAEVTMIQRAPSIVVRSETLMELAWGRLYSEAALTNGITTDIADLTLASVPFKELPGLQRPLYAEIARRDADLYEGLTRAGFLHDMGEDGSGLHSIYLRRGAGYYIDVGASQMIIDGRIRLKHGSVAELGERTVVLSDGTTLPADLVVFATGYGNMSEWAAKLISPEVAARVGPVWGLGSGTKNDPGPWEGELRNMWKPTAQPGLWFHGGNLTQSRHYSLYLALRLKARVERFPVPI